MGTAKDKFMISCFHGLHLSLGVILQVHLRAEGILAVQHKHYQLFRIQSIIDCLGGYNITALTLTDFKNYIVSQCFCSRMLT